MFLAIACPAVVDGGQNVIKFFSRRRCRQRDAQRMIRCLKRNRLAGTVDEVADQDRLGLEVAGQPQRLRHAPVVAQQDAKVYFPALEYCTDNGAMIAYAGALRLQAGQSDVEFADVLPRWSLEDLSPI